MAQPQDILLKFIQGGEGRFWALGRTGWSGDAKEPVCQWEGVSCDTNDSITEIVFSSTDFLGTIPTEVGLLSSLRKFDAQHNLMSGTIPSQFANLPNLEKVDISDNLLSGGLVSFASGALTMLDINSNRLNGTIPQDFGKSNGRLTHLDLRENQLTGAIPTSLETLTALTLLSLSKNSLSGTLPSFLGMIAGLKYVYLSRNHFVGTISSTWGVNGSQLTEVWLQNNLLSGTIPPSLSGLSQLVNLYLDGNKLTGKVPNGVCSPTINADFLTTTSAAEGLNQDSCGVISCPVGTIGLDGVSPCFPCNSTVLFNPYLGRQGQCSNQTETDIVGMLLAKKSANVSKIPIQIDSACHYQGVTCNQDGHVERIDVSGMGLTGTIPDELGFLPYLKVLKLSGNRFSGFLPSGLRFAPLEELDVSGNQLRGSVPPLLCNNRINGNGVDGVFNCAAIACPVGTYSPTGRGQCQTCDRASTFLGSTSCDSSAESVTQNKSEGSHVGITVAIVFIAIGVFVGVVCVRFVMSKHLKRKKQVPKNLERGQIIREFNGEPNLPNVNEIKGNGPPSKSSSPIIKFFLWFGRDRTRVASHDDEERLDFKSTIRSNEVDDYGWNERRDFVIDDDDDDDQSELERIVQKQKMEGGTEVWEYPDPLERSLASWTKDDDIDAQEEFKRNALQDHPKELWLDVPRV